MLAHGEPRHQLARWGYHRRVAFDLQPELRGDLLRLRPLGDADFDALFAVASDPLIWEQRPANDRYKEDIFQAFFARRWPRAGR